MIENNFDKETTDLKKKINDQEKGIIEGTILVKDLNEFNSLYAELNGILDNLSDIYKNTKTKENKEKLDSYLNEELDYLDEISKLLEDLNRYHDIVGIVDDNTIKNEWNDVSVILLYKNLERTKKRLTSLLTIYPDEYDSEIGKVEQKLASIEKQVLISQENMIQKKETVVNTIVTENTTIDSDELRINEVAFAKMNLDERIYYVEKIMENISKTRGKKMHLTIDGETKNITSKYASRYMSYHAILNNLYLEKDELEKNIIDEAIKFSDTNEVIEEDIDEQELNVKIEKYLTLREESISIISDIVNRASEEDAPYLKVNVSLPTEKGYSVAILKSDLEKYNEACNTYKEAIKAHEELINQNDEINSDNEKKNILKEISFLITSGVVSSKVKEIVGSLALKHQKINKKDKSKKMANLVLFFREKGLSLKDSYLYAKYISAINKFKSNKDIDDEEKRSVLSNIIAKLDDVKETAKMNAYGSLGTISGSVEATKMDIRDAIDNFKNRPESDDNKLKMNAYALGGSVLGSIEATKMDISDAIDNFKNRPKKEENKENKNNFVVGALVGAFAVSKLNIMNAGKTVKKAFSELASKNGKILKIKNKCKAIDKEKIKTNVKKNASKIGIGLGFMVLMGGSLYVASKNKTSDVTNNNTDVYKEADNLDDLKMDYLTGIKSLNLNETKDESATEEEVVTDENLGDSLENDNESYVEDTSNEDVFESSYFTVKDNAPIYTNMYDAATETNTLNPYFEADSEREIAGIAYDYNGSMIFLDINDSDFMVKKASLEKSGAKQVAVLAKNEGDNYSEVEGFYNVDDINLGGTKR